MKYELKLLATKLRKQGKSYSEILHTVKVSKATLSLWLRDIQLTPQQINKIYINKKQKNSYKLAKQKQIKKTKGIEIIKQNSNLEIKKLKDNPLFVAGLMLYWAEGDKSESIELVKFSNSDPKMINFMMFWFKNFFHIQNDKFRIALHIHEYLKENEVKLYWSEITGISLKQFHKTQIKPTSIGHRKKMLYNGTCSIRISSRTLFRKIKWLTNAFLEEIDKNIKI